ncbi:MAG: hypothetical protein ACR2JK_11150 [Geodermatophilaceae bacterium]
MSLLSCGGTADVPPLEPPYRAFSSTSWWNTALATSVPQHPDESAILNYLRTAPENGGGFLRLAGAGDNGWGQPVYWAGAGDPEYNVEWADDRRPPELDNLRIPVGARAADTSDGSLTLFDLERGYVVAMTDAVNTAGRWSISGVTITYLDSNGLSGQWPQSDELANMGSHRGNNGAVMMARWDEVRSGAIDHVLKISVGPETNTRHVFPLVGSDGDSGTSPIPQGLRIRIRPSVNLATLGLQPEALVIAQAAQGYGVYFGDSGGNTMLKLENTRAEGRGQLWSVTATALAGLPFTTEFWDVVSEGYDPSAD